MIFLTWLSTASISASVGGCGLLIFTVSLHAQQAHKESNVKTQDTINTILVALSDLPLFPSEKCVPMVVLASGTPNTDATADCTTKQYTSGHNTQLNYTMRAWALQ